MPTLKNSNATFLVIFKQCESQFSESEKSEDKSLGPRNNTLTVKKWDNS